MRLPAFISVMLLLCASGCTSTRPVPTAAPATLKVTIVIPEIYDPEGQHPSPRTLVNQQSDARFHVVIENVSAHPISLNGGANPLSFELTEADGSVVKIARDEVDGSRKSFAIRLAPGELQICEVYYTTQEQYFAVTRHAPFAGRTWSPEFPFARNKDQTVTLRAIYEQRPSGLSTAEKLWTGRVVSAPCKVVLVYP
jgi:hypothetical protein